MLGHSRDLVLRHQIIWDISLKDGSWSMKPSVTPPLHSSAMAFAALTNMARLLSLPSSTLRLSLLYPTRRLISTAAPTAYLLSRPPTFAPSTLAARFTALRSQSDDAGNSSYSPLGSGSNSPKSFTFERPPTDMAPLFPGCDYNHWLIVMDKPGGEGATKQKMIDCYVQTLAKVLGSEQEAKKKIYNVSCERYFGFGCEIDEETSNKLEGLPGVLFVLPDSYVDPEYKDYGGEDL
ncbi:hypothetical protein RJT34_24298 [Clitoria ternatea]|uniref:MORF/ORRM1/DAG-like MORF domain-containing protein n=1 Tax=Clitoria ternatea TaxID=43366 RepID=A0AAN9IL81_CLITE